jgi:hypothetical protein
MTFEEVAEGWIFCTPELLQRRWEKARPLARTARHREVLEKMLTRYLEELVAVRRRQRVEGLEAPAALTDLVIQRGHADRYAGPLRHGRFQVLESLAPVGTFYVADHAAADLLLRVGGFASEIWRFDSLGAAELTTDRLASVAPPDAPPRRGLNLPATGEPKESVMAKKAQKAEKTAADKKPRGQGIGARTRELIMQGLDVGGVIEKLRKEFPAAANSASNVNYYRNQLKKEGAAVPSLHGNGGEKAKPAKAAAAPKKAAKKGAGATKKGAGRGRAAAGASA